MLALKFDINISNPLKWENGFSVLYGGRFEWFYYSLMWIFDANFSGAKDADSKPENLTFTMVSSDDLNTLGYLSLQKDKSVNRFTQHDLELNRIFFTHQGKSTKCTMLEIRQFLPENKNLEIWKFWYKC